MLQEQDFNQEQKQDQSKQNSQEEQNIQKLLDQEFSDEPIIDTSVKCEICGHEGKDITIHLKMRHKLTSTEYKQQYNNAKVVCGDVELKRRETCKEVYGNENYKNKEGALLSNETFEGGHSLKDPAVLAKIRETKQELYGDPTFTNREKAKETCLKRYGVEYTCQVPEVIEKRVATLKAKYGRVFNVDRPHNKKDPPETFKEDYSSGTSISDLCTKYGISEPTLTMCIKELNLPRRGVAVTERVSLSPAEMTTMYMKDCIAQGRVITFYEYSRIKGQRYGLKIKRLFGSKALYGSLYEELTQVALKPELWGDFLKKLV